MTKLKENLPKIISVVIPCVLFVTLLLIATCFDLEISKALVSGLAPGEFYTKNIFAIIIEVIGSFPIWTFGFFATLVLYRSFCNRKDKLKYLQYLFAFGAFVVATIFARDTFKYIFRFSNKEELIDKFYMLLIYASFGVLSTALGIFFFLRMKDETIAKFLKMSLVIVCSCAFYLLIEVIKTPVGRIRYRAMNQVSDFSLFMPWYHFGNKDLANIEVLKEILPHDGFKSFPSGHTFSAAIIFNLICLPELFEKFNNLKSKIIINVVCTLYVFLVAIFRIVAGAHFLSDVTVGGFIAYTSIRVFKYVFIDRKKVVNG